MCPPSRAGIGSRFNTPKFTEMSAVKKKSESMPAELAWAVTSTMVMIPPSLSVPTTPVMSFCTDSTMSQEAFLVSSQA